MVAHEGRESDGGKALEDNDLVLGHGSKRKVIIAGESVTKNGKYYSEKCITIA